MPRGPRLFELGFVNQSLHLPSSIYGLESILNDCLTQHHYIVAQYNN